jgi:hypothetical protein
MTTTFTFTILTTDTGLAVRVCEAIAELIAQPAGTTPSDQIETPAGPSSSPDGIGAPNIRQIVDALAYRPLTPTQLLLLKEWEKAEDWTPVAMLHQRVLDEGLVRDIGEAVPRVRAELSGLANRMSRKVTPSTKERSKLGALVEIRREGGSASYRLHDEGRTAVKTVLKM